MNWARLVGWLGCRGLVVSIGLLRVLVTNRIEIDLDGEHIILKVVGLEGLIALRRRVVPGVALRPRGAEIGGREWLLAGVVPVAGVGGGLVAGGAAEGLGVDEVGQEVVGAAGGFVEVGRESGFRGSARGREEVGLSSRGAIGVEVVLGGGVHEGCDWLGDRGLASRGEGSGLQHWLRAKGVS